MKKLIVFDLGGRLAESKVSVDTEMANLLNVLLGMVKVSVISGGDWSQFEKQVLANLSHDDPAKEAGALSIEVKDPHETKRVIEAIIACVEQS